MSSNAPDCVWKRFELELKCVSSAEELKQTISEFTAANLKHFDHACIVRLLDDFWPTCPSFPSLDGGPSVTLTKALKEALKKEVRSFTGELDGGGGKRVLCRPRALALANFIAELCYCDFLQPSESVVREFISKCLEGDMPQGISGGIVGGTHSEDAIEAVCLLLLKLGPVMKDNPLEVLTTLRPAAQQIEALMRSAQVSERTFPSETRRAALAFLDQVEVGWNLCASLSLEGYWNGWAQARLCFIGSMKGDPADCSLALLPENAITAIVNFVCHGNPWDGVSIAIRPISDETGPKTSTEAALRVDPRADPRYRYPLRLTNLANVRNQRDGGYPVPVDSVD